MRRIGAVLVAAAVGGLMLGGAAPASAGPGTTTTYIVASCQLEQITSWRDTPATQIGSAHGGGTIELVDYYYNATTHAWAVLGTESNTFVGFLNYRSGAGHVHGDWHLTSAVIGDYDGTFITSMGTRGKAPFTSVGKSTDGRSQIRVTMGLDPASYQPLPTCTAPWVSSTTVAEMVVMHG